MGWGGRLVPVNCNALGLRILQQRPVPLGKPPQAAPAVPLAAFGGCGRCWGGDESTAWWGRSLLCKEINAADEEKRCLSLCHSKLSRRFLSAVMVLSGLGPLSPRCWWPRGFCSWFVGLGFSCGLG